MTCSFEYDSWIDILLTFTGHSEKNQATGLGDIGCNEILDHLDIVIVATLADAGNEAYDTVISDGEIISQSPHSPGKSQKDKSATSFPLICRETQLVENVNS